MTFHLAANPEARWGLERTRSISSRATIATYNALEAARVNDVKKFVFSSSGTVYGNVDKPCAEGDLGSLPISLYGASKFARRGDDRRVRRVLRARGLHLPVRKRGRAARHARRHPRFLQEVAAHPDYLDVLGDGRQAKPYLHVTDCVSGILYVLENGCKTGGEPVPIYNLAPPDTTSVTRIAELCVAASPNKAARIEYGTTT